MSDLVACADGKTRCAYRIDDPVYQHYHDTQFGRPTADDRIIFRKICIEAFAAGLSFHGTLRKMPAMDAAFENFEIARVAEFDAAKIADLLEDAALIRNAAKVNAAVHNARCMREIIADVGSLAAFVWQFEPPRAERPERVTSDTVRTITQTRQSEDLAKALKKRGLKFVGPVSMYGVFQGCGLINDHYAGCDVGAECDRARAAFEVPQPRDARG
ncbi:DNA-3-methyladenine glycosylase I [Sulfitobacter sp. S190]|uniref:DNA-3-methyladenine glycosylase I n=1 Tax=Sulfitobacter sp. S190 TaxID=2867022 RepID=UPI0021A4EB04|nr:DNA-3-methyladenine glycosylase I [Sulfitobacter sp. S190]UWR24544.1 DNA-3-methyladenine glycosylase I [Sulfitobacter sp. S190]